MEYLYYNSVELLPNAKASAAFTADSSKVFKEQVDIPPIGIDKGLSYVPWGMDNQMPYNILDLIESDETLSTCQIFNAEVCYGSGLLYNTANCSNSVQDDIEDFFLDNNMPGYFFGVCQDFKHFGFCVTVVILNKDGFKVVRIVRKEACYCRFTPANKEGRIEKVLYANWRNNIASRDDIEAIELLDAASPWSDLKDRMAAKSKTRKFAIVTRVPTPNSTYYPIPYYAALLKGKWYNIKTLIGMAKEAKLKNSAPIKYHITASIIQKHVIRSLQNVIVDLFTDTKCATRHTPHRLLSDIVQMIRSHEEEFPQWHVSHVAKFFTPPIFENKKENKGYWF